MAYKKIIKILSDRSKSDKQKIADAKLVAQEKHLRLCERQMEYLERKRKKGSVDSVDSTQRKNVA